MSETKELHVVEENPKKYKKVINMLRFAYFAYYFSVGCIQTFYPIVLNKVHVPNSQIGVLTSIGLIGGTISPILIGFVADKTKKSRLILIVITLATIILHLIPILSILFKIYIHKFTAQRDAENSQTQPDFHIGTIFMYFLYFTQFMITFGDQGSKALMDSVSHKVIVESDKIGYTVDFSRIRMLGGLGIGLSSFVSGICLDYVKWMLPNFPEDICLLTLCLLMGSLCVATLIVYIPNVETKEEVQFVKALLDICTRTEVIVCYFTQFCLQFATNITKNYESLYIKHIGGNKTLIGISMCFGYLTDVAMMYYSKLLTEAIGSREMTISIAAFVATIRTFLYGFADSAYLAISNGILSGFSVGLYLPTMSTHVRQKAPKNLISSYVSLLTGIGKIGASISSYVGGVISEKYSYTMIYSISALSYFFSGGLLMFFYFISRLIAARKAKKEAKYNPDDIAERKRFLSNEEPELITVSKN